MSVTAFTSVYPLRLIEQEEIREMRDGDGINADTHLFICSVSSKKENGKCEKC